MATGPQASGADGDAAAGSDRPSASMDEVDLGALADALARLKAMDPAQRRVLLQQVTVPLRLPAGTSCLCLSASHLFACGMVTSTPAIQSCCCRHSEGEHERGCGHIHQVQKMKGCT